MWNKRSKSLEDILWNLNSLASLVMCIGSLDSSRWKKQPNGWALPPYNLYKNIYGKNSKQSTWGFISILTKRGLDRFFSRWQKIYSNKLRLLTLGFGLQHVQHWGHRAIMHIDVAHMDTTTWMYNMLERKIEKNVLWSCFQDGIMTPLDFQPAQAAGHERRVQEVKFSSRMVLSDQKRTKVPVQFE
jgi:hypothetical protein